VPIGHFHHPVYVTSPPHAKHTVIVAERSGRIRAVVRGHVRKRPFADLRSRVIVPARGDLCTGKLWSARFTGTTLVDDRPLKRTCPT
jgi:hypothetical protein